MLNYTIEIVDFPINSMVIFNSYVSHYQRVIHGLGSDLFGRSMTQALMNATGEHHSAMFGLDGRVSRRCGGHGGVFQMGWLEGSGESPRNLIVYWMFPIWLVYFSSRFG